MTNPTALTSAAFLQPSSLRHPLTMQQVRLYQDCPADLSLYRETPSEFRDLTAERAIRHHQEVTNLARQFHSDVHSVPSQDPLEKRIQWTQRALADPNIPVLLKGAFYYVAREENHGIVMTADQLIRQGEGAFKLVNVVSSTSVQENRAYVSKKTGEVTIKTPLKKDVLFDLAMQLYILEKNQVAISEAELWHPSPEYESPGGFVHEPDAFFDFVSVSLEGLRELYPQVEELLQNIEAHLKAEQPNRFHDTSCNIFKDQREVWDLSILRPNKALREYFDANDVKDIRQIPEDLSLLNEKQKRIVQAVKTNSLVVDQEKLKTGLDQIHQLLTQPGAKISFLDFETAQMVAAFLKGARPYEHLLLQFSNHKLDSLEEVLTKKEGDIEHNEHLYHGDIDADWAKEMSLKILETVGESGPIVVWYEHFEIGRIAELAERMQRRGELEIAQRLFDLVGGDKRQLLEVLAKQAESEGKTEVAQKIRSVIGLGSTALGNMAAHFAKYLEEPAYAARLLEIKNNKGRIVDLLDIVENSVYHPDLKGSFSLKVVLPALTGRSYDELAADLNNGLEAMETLEQILLPATSPAEKRQLIEKALTYCSFDTMAEVWILQALLKAA